MGKFRTRVKGKGKRWRKGQSSSSNPETNTHRKAAKSRFFQENLRQSNLTSDALQKHNAFMGSQPVGSGEETDETTTIGTFKTFQTFATDWSECSNMTFNRLLRGFDSNSSLQKEMLAILAAVTEVIKTNGGQGTSTEYFGALMTTLEASEADESVAAVLSLLGMGMKTVPDNVLRLKFSEASKTFMDLLAKYADSNNNVIMRSLIGCLSVLLRVQDGGVWSDASTMKVFESILSFTIHSKPKIRKAAQHAAGAILKGSSVMLRENPPSHHPAASHTAKFCINHLESGGSLGASTTTLHILTFLKEILGTFPKTQLKQACEAILKVMTLGDVLILSCGMQALHGLFASHPPASTLPAVLNAQLISALFDYQPSSADQQPVLAWLAVMQEAYVNLGRLDLNLWSANLPRLFAIATQLWLERTDVMSGATLTMEAIVEGSMKEACLPEKVRLYKAMVQKVIQSVEAGLKYQFHSAWPYVLHLLGVIFEHTGETCYDMLQPCLKLLGELQDTEEFTFKKELENAVGQAIRSMGPEKVLSAIPLEITGEETNYEFKRSWLLPVLKENIKAAPLKFFIDYFLPLATICRRKAQLKENVVAAHSYDLLQTQIWSLLPSFCINTPDVVASFKHIAKILGTIIVEPSDVRLSVMQALRRLVTDSQEKSNENNVSELRRFAKNYLPILFNVYTTKPKGSDVEGQRLAAFETIKVYLTIASPELHEELFDRACTKLHSAEADDFVRKCVMELLRTLIIYQRSEKIQVLCNQIAESLKDLNNKHQKPAYRLLEEICGSDSDNCQSFVNEHIVELEDLLLSTVATTASSSKGARLRCLTYLLQRMDTCEISTIQKILSEAITCCKDINEKCREAAFDLVVYVGDAMTKVSEVTAGDSMNEFIKLLLAGLMGSPSLISATLLALAKVAYEYRDVLTEEIRELLLDNVTLLVASSTREIVQSALSYLKVYITSVPVVTLGPLAPRIVKGLLAMTDDCQRHFRQKCRDILDRLVRKFGYEAIAGLVPKTDTIMHKRLRNLRKINDRKKKAKQRGEGGGSDDDEEELFVMKGRPKSIQEILEESDSDFEDSETKKSSGTKKSKHKAWIQEDADTIVDFTDASASKNIVATHPSAAKSIVSKKGKKIKETPFKIASDGRLIIKDNSDDDDDDGGGGGGRKRKKKIIQDSDSDDELDDMQSTVTGSVKLPANRKRKFSVTSSVASEPAFKYQAGGSGIHRPIARAKQQSKPQRGPKGATGEEYKAKKAKGDVKKKGMPDPYAYIPLSRKLLNKRKKVKQAGQYKNLVKAARRGAMMGSQAKAKKQKQRK